MQWQDLLVLISVGLIITSGLWINIQKSEDKSEIAPDNQQDGGSLRLFRVLVPLSILLSTLLYFLRWPINFGQTEMLIIGFTFVGLGLLLRWWAVRHLGQAFTVQLQVRSAQRLISDGPFRLVRHPSYSGLLLYYLGLGLVMGNPLSLLILVILPAWAVLNRVSLEEKLLQEHFGEAYRVYQTRTWRLLPWVY
ncbi:MAG: isoprenylcysteine carboxylmethyltransferase family protein [Bacteroidota bacterium]